MSANLLANVSTSASGSSATGSWVTVPALTSGTVSVAGTSSVILLVMQITLDDTSDDEIANFRFAVDGSPISGTPVVAGFADGVNELSGTTMAWFCTGISAGNHTFTAEWIAATLSPAIATDRPRTFQVLEIENATIEVDVGSVSSQADPASWADMTDMTGTFTTASGAVHLVAMNFTPDDTADASSDLRFAVDATRRGPFSSTWSDATNDHLGTSMLYAIDDLSAASHTFALQWQARQGSGTTSTALNRTFQVVEITSEVTLEADVDSVSDEADPAAWAAMDAMTGTATPSATEDVTLVVACGVLDDISTDNTTKLMLADDGTREGAEIWTFSDEANGIPGFLLVQAKDGETANSTWTLQWEEITGSGNTDTSRNRTFQILKFAAAVGGGAPGAGSLGSTGVGW